MGGALRHLSNLSIGNLMYPFFPNQGRLYHVDVNSDDRCSKLRGYRGPLVLATCVSSSYVSNRCIRVTDTMATYIADVPDQNSQPQYEPVHEFLCLGSTPCHIWCQRTCGWL